MKERFLGILGLTAAVFFLFSCGNQGSAGNASAANSDTLSQNPVYQEGVALVGKNDCLTCHTVSQSGTGPAFNAIAKRYALHTDSIPFLAEKILKGGSGHWGTIPMTPHPNVTSQEAEAMVKYILMLKDQ